MHGCRPIAQAGQRPGPTGVAAPESAAKFGTETPRHAMARRARSNRTGLPYQVPRYLLEMRQRRREDNRSIMPYVLIAAFLLGVWLLLSYSEPRVSDIDSGDRQAPTIHWGGGQRS